LPKYSGPGKITGLTLSFTGNTLSTIFWNYFVENGITEAPLDSTADFFVFGPPSFLETELLDVPTSVNYPGFSIPPCPECGFGPTEVNISSDLVTFLGRVNLTDFSDFAGSGSNDFVIQANPGSPTETIDASATVTETIFTSVPEPSTWARMIAGFAGIGWLAHMRRRKLASA